MSEQLQLAVVAAAAIILSGLVSAAAALKGVAIQSRFSHEQNERQRQWAVQDALRARGAEITERRCQQVEKFVEANTEEFHVLVDACEFLLRADNSQDAAETREHYLAWRDQRDRRVFANAPAIRALGDEQLYKYWLEITQTLLRLAQHAGFIYSEKFEYGRPVGTDEMVDKIAALRTAYEIAGGHVLAQLDKIRSDVK